jgi:hypothetical protein
MLRTVNRPLDRLAEATSASRDRAVDFLRAFGVVVIWHWALSVTHRTDGRLVMPNPIDDVPLGWLATWLFQVLPVFFIVGGYANLAAWDSVRRSGGGTGRFLRKRWRGCLAPWPCSRWSGWWSRWHCGCWCRAIPGCWRWPWWCSCRYGSWPPTSGWCCWCR